jgi:hypothetical protein
MLVFTRQVWETCRVNTSIFFIYNQTFLLNKKEYIK